MGLFEQLEHEAERQRRDAAQREIRRRMAAARWVDTVRPRMQALDHALHGLVARLKEQQPVARVAWTLPGYGDVVGYIDHQYTLQSLPGEDAWELALGACAEVASDECPLVAAEGIPAVTEVAAALWAQRLFGVLESQRNRAGEAVSARFRARGRVLMGLRVVASIDGGVQLHSWNLGGFGPRCCDLRPEQLQPSLFDMFARFLAPVGQGASHASICIAESSCGRRADGG